jgi:hypothetical protein
MITDSPVATSWKIALAVTVLFAGFGTLGILHHEMWLDETHHWLLSFDNFSLGEMIFNARYEGHPLLWNVLLYVLSHATSDPVSMQVLNLIISAAGVFLLLRYSPFSLVNKILIVCSYFIFYEYTIIARNYALVFLLLVIVCILYKKKQERFLLFSFVLALLAQAHLFSAIISGTVFLLACFEFYKSNNEKKFPRFFIPGMLILLSSLALVVVEVMPPADHFLYAYDTDPLLSYKRIGKGFSVLWKGLFPVPAFGSDHPWNTNFAVTFSKQLALVPIMLAWFIPAVLLIKKKQVLIFFYVTAFSIALFIYFSPIIVSVRHCGIFFLLLLAALWMAEYSLQPEELKNKFSIRFKQLSGRAARPLFIVILTAQVIAGVYMYIIDWNRPFSNGKAVAEWLAENADPLETVVVNDHFTGPPVSAYRGRRVFYAENNAMGSFCKWNTQPFMISQDTLFTRALRLLERENRQTLFLVSDKPLAESSERINARFIKDFPGALVQAENYWIYELQKK